MESYQLGLHVATMVSLNFSLSVCGNVQIVVNPNNKIALATIAQFQIGFVAGLDFGNAASGVNLVDLTSCMLACRF